MAIRITSANMSDLSVLDSITTKLKGKIFGDKAYIFKGLFNNLYSHNLRLFTGIRKNMKNHLLDLEDKILLRKRLLIESVFNVLKKSMNLEHLRYRSTTNFVVHILACINAFNLYKSNLPAPFITKNSSPLS